MSIETSIGTTMNSVLATDVLALAPPTAVGWFTYLVIGGIAGWLAGKIVRGGGQGILLNVIIGVVGGFLGGFLLEQVNVDVPGGKRWFTFFTSLLGAVILVWLVGLVRGNTKRR